jgi:hypothetical protein
MTRSPQSDAAANGANPKEELYRLACKYERESARLRDIIKRASVAFFGDGTDGETASAMLVILDEVNSLSNVSDHRCLREAGATNTER